MTDSRDGSADTPGANTADGEGARFPSLDGTVDMTRRRLKILAILSDGPLWKQRLGERFAASVQTLGRDVDALHADGLLETTLVSAADANRSMLIGFATTDDGRNALDDYRVWADCGDVVDARSGCVHEYVPVDAAFDANRGDR